VTLVFSLMRALQGQTQASVGAVYYAAMLVFYSTLAASGSRMPSLLACVQAGGGLLLATLLSPANELVHLVNDVGLVLMSGGFALQRL